MHDCNSHSMTKLSGWLRYFTQVGVLFTTLVETCNSKEYDETSFTSFRFHFLLVLTKSILSRGCEQLRYWMLGTCA